MKKNILLLLLAIAFVSTSLSQEVVKAYNTAFSFYGLEDQDKVYNDIKKLDDVENPVLRFPGGTIANRYRLDGVDYGTTNFTNRNFIYDFIDMCKVLDADVIVVLNLFEELVFGINLFEQNIAVIQTFLDAGLDVVGVEAGNEFNIYPEITGLWFPGLINFQKRKVERNVQRYVDLADKYAFEIKRRYNIPCGLVIGKNNNKRDKIWNNVVHGSLMADFYILHYYFDLKSNYNRSRIKFIEDLPVLANGKKIWITEYNGQFGFRSDQNTEEFLSDKHLLFLKEFTVSWCDPKYVELAALHNLLGNENNYNKFVVIDGETVKRY